MQRQKLLLHEVGMRDGLQMEEEVVPLEQKIRWIQAIGVTGVDVIQVGSFVHPSKVPQMADTDELFRALKAAGKSPAVLSALVLNEKGIERAFACGVEMLCMGVSASETHSQKNTGMSVAEASTRICNMAQEARKAGVDVQVSVQSAFGCGFEGPIPQERVLGIVRRYLEGGLRRVSLADTAGHATPLQVEQLVGEILKMDEGIELACHFHNTYGMALGNCYAAWRAGVESFESSVGGLGGCPFTKRPGGNVSTEDLVHMLQRMDRRKDVNLQALIAVACDVARFFSRDLEGVIYRTGPIGNTQPG